MFVAEETMPIRSTTNPILTRFRAVLDDVYGDRLDRVVLYGSRARDEAHAESDYDVAVFLTDMPDRWQELNRLADLSTALLDETGELVHAMPYQADTYADPRMPLMHEIRREGIDL